MKITLLLLLILCSSFSFSQTFSGSVGNISDDGLANDFTVTTSGLSSTLGASAGLVQVCLDITHTYDSDLNVHLVAPDGTEINLFSGIGGGDDNFTNTCLSQSATIIINAVSAPFTGTFKPQESLGNVNNAQNGNGIWKLRIVDTYAADAGILNSWSITFGSGASVPIVFASSNLPIVIINTNGVAIPDEPKINGTMKIIDNGLGMINHINDAPNNYNGNIGIEMRGAYSQGLPQKPYGFETRDTNNNTNNVSLLNMPAEHDWCLIANYNDKVFMRNSLAYKLFSNMGHYAARNRFCEVVVNGSYQGIYLLMETLKPDSNRINIAKLDSSENTGINVTGGYILKNDYWDANNSWLSNYHPVDNTNLDVNIVYHYPNPDKITPAQKLYIQNFIDDFETALYSNNYTDVNNGYRKYLSTNSFIDYFIINELSRNNDGFKKSSYFHKDKNTTTSISKLKAGPVWDFDWAWKNINECSIFSATDGSGWAHHVNDCGPDVTSTGWYIRLMQDSSFQNDLRCRWEYFRSNILSNNSLNNYIDSVATYLDSAQMRHFEKWGNLGVNTGAPEIDNDPTTFAGEIAQFKNWINLRLTWLDSNIPGNTNNCNFTSVSENKKSTLFTIYPNPANNHLYVSSAKANNIEFYDITGKLISSSKLNSIQNIFDVSEFSNGIYFCKIYTGIDLLKTEKIIVIH